MRPSGASVVAEKLLPLSLASREVDRRPALGAGPPLVLRMEGVSALDAEAILVCCDERPQLPLFASQEPLPQNVAGEKAGAEENKEERLPRHARWSNPHGREHDPERQLAQQQYPPGH